MTFDADEATAALNTPNIEGRYPADEYTIVDGKAVKKSDSVIEEQDIALAWIKLRMARNDMIAQSDWTQSADVQSTMTDEKKAAWQSYRTSLRLTRQHRRSTHGRISYYTIKENRWQQKKVFGQI